MTAAVCMIVRDGAATIERAIASVRSHVDEICIYLAGESTDGTPQLLERLAGEPGAPIVVEEGAWRDDYAWARERSFELASADWLLWLDDDEVLEHSEQLRQLLDEPDALRVPRLDERERGTRLLWDVRAVRAAAGARWERPIHEHLVLPPAAAMRVAAPSTLRVVHRPVLDVAGRHDHEPLQEAAFASGRWPSLALYVARSRLWDGDVDAAETIVKEFLAHLGPDANGTNSGYLWALRLLAGAAQRRGDTAIAAAFVRQHDRVRMQTIENDPVLRAMAHFNSSELERLGATELDPA
jgi:glycosyltransferase involved in cell wall biosynthesis